MKRQKLVRKSEVEAVVQHYKPLLGLSAWQHFIVMDMSSKGDCIASALAQPDQLTFSLVFAPRCFANDIVKQPRVTSLAGTIIHELLHVALWPLVSGLAEGCTYSADEIHRIRELLEEPLVDPLSRTLARYLPKPR